MSTIEPWRSPASQDMSMGTYSKNLKEADNVSVYSSKQGDMENMSEAEFLEKYKLKIQDYQLKDAKYRQKETKLQKQNDYLKKKIASLKLRARKIEEHRLQDADALLDQEEKLSNLKGRYRKSDNPNEVVKIKKNIQTCVKQENEARQNIKKCIEGTTRLHEQVEELAPSFYEDLRGLKFYGDKNMNEVLLRQINIYVERLSDKSREFEKLKADQIDQNKQLRFKLKDSYKAHDELKADWISDYKNLYALQRQLNFYESDYILDREQNNTQAGNRTSKSLMTSKSQMNETGASVFDNGIITKTEQEELTVKEHNTDILSRLRDRLDQTKHKDIDVQKIIDRLPQ